MNKSIGLQLIVYSLLLAGLSYLTYNLARLDNALGGPDWRCPPVLFGVFGRWPGSPGKALALTDAHPFEFRVAFANGHWLGRRKQ